MKRYEVLIVCPRNNVAVATQFVMDEAYYRSTSIEESSMRCSSCGAVHSWSKADSALGPEIPTR